MKKKIIGIFVSTLLIATLILPASGKMTVSTNFNNHHNEIISESLLLENGNYPMNNLIDEYIINTMSSYYIPGLSATIVKDDSVFWTNSYGYANISNDQLVENTTLFYLASVSKTITATAIMQLYEEDYFELNDPINDYLPFEVNHPDYPDIDITFLMLMTHTSSIQDNWNFIFYINGDPTVPLGEFLEEYLTPGGEYYDSGENFYSSEPGTYYGYCNVGAALIGYLVENISGVPFDEYCETNIFQPLDMAETAWFLADLNVSNIAVPYFWEAGDYVPYAHYCTNVYPAGSLRTSVTQLRNFLIMMMNDGVYNSTQILQASTVELMLTQQLEWLELMGIIWWHYDLYGRLIWCHPGTTPGCRTAIAIDPETNIGVILLTNSANNAYNTITSKLFDFAENQPPYTPSSPEPENGSTDVSIYTDLSWTGGDPDGDDLTYDVYFEAGDSTPDELVSENQSDTTYDPDTLEENTEYYWRIVAWDEWTSETGPIWSFTTGENLPPNEPSDPDPPDGATDVPIVKILSWIGGDPNPGDTVLYDVYFGNSSPPPMVAEDLSETSYDPDTMDLDTTYYWQIVAEDSQGLSTSGDIWYFTTELEPNEPPNAPNIKGETNGKNGKEYEYTFSATDPEDNDVYFWIEWGDGANTSWIGPYKSDEEITLGHSWTEEGKYTIEAQAKDEKEAKSIWKTLDVTMPKNKIYIFNFPLLNWLFERFPNAFPMLRYMLGL